MPYLNVKHELCFYDGKRWVVCTDNFGPDSPDIKDGRFVYGSLFRHLVSTSSGTGTTYMNVEPKPLWLAPPANVGYKPQRAPSMADMIDLTPEDGEGNAVTGMSVAECMLAQEMNHLTGRKDHHESLSSRLRTLN